MILTLIKKINNIIIELLYILQNSNIYLNNKYNEYENIITNDDINIFNLISLSEYIYIINNYIFNIIINDKKKFNENINNKIQEINVNINNIINIIYNNINQDEICTYIKNSNHNELISILYILFITKILNKCIYDSIISKLSNLDIYLNNNLIYNYDSLICNNNQFDKLDKTGLNVDFIKSTQFINNNIDFTKKGELKKLNNNIMRHNKFINNYINNYFNEISLTQNEYKNTGVLIDYGKSIEIQIYNDYTRKHAYNKGVMNKTEISVFELFNL
tara:strand:- start:1139 stop:1963 length:825 start_codon:yes stop_codon:yes gene_type:complete